MTANTEWLGAVSDFTLAHEAALRLGCFAGVTAVMACWEVLAPRRPRAFSRWKRWPHNLGIAAVNTMAARVLVPTAAVGVAMAGETQGWGLFNAVDIPAWTKVAVSIVLLDLAIYLQHVIFHAVPALWRLGLFPRIGLNWGAIREAWSDPATRNIARLMVPALFAAFPGAPPATLLGTNKAASVWGTAMATWQYSRKVQVRWSAMLPAAGAGFAGSFAGAWAVTVMSADFLRKLLPLVLLGVLAYTLVKKELGRHHTPRFTGQAEVLAASLIGLLIGFYDGFFGPGTGSFFVFLFVRLLGYDFLNASASAKLLNCATNIAAIALFAAKGHVWWHFAVTLAIANVVGSLLGTHLALKHGTGFVRGIFIVVVSSLILKTGYDAFLR